jgi:hypothetical protein
MFLPCAPQFIDRDIQDYGQNNADRRESGESPEIHNNPALRHLVPQEAYKPLRRQKGPEIYQTLEFFVHGERGVCLSDALEEQWAGFEGRDDASLFEDSSIQVTLRLLVSPLSIASLSQQLIPVQIVGCPRWQSKVKSHKISTLDQVSYMFEFFTTDHTAARRPIKRTKVAIEVAKSVKKFLKVHRGPMESSALDLT